MMLTIHGLPPRTTFQTLKTLIKQECNIIDFILDNLVDDGSPNSKKVRIGVSDDNEGYRIINCLDGFRMSPTHLLKIIPVGKAINQQQNYNQRDQGPGPGFQNQPRNDYPNQSRQDYQNNDYGRGPPTQPDRHTMGPGGDNRHYGMSDDRNAGPRPPFRPNVDQRPMGHPNPEARNQGPPVQEPLNPWGPNTNSNNNPGWIPPQNQNQPQSFNERPNQGMTSGFGQQQSQVPQDTFGQGRGPGPQGPLDTSSYGQRPQDQRFGFQPKPNISGGRPDSRAHNLRSVDIVDTPRHTPYQQDKPITIMKDNFQGPTQYNISGQPHNQFQGQNQAQWNQQNQQPKPQMFDERRHGPSNKRPDMPKQMDQDYEKRGHFSQMSHQSSPGREILMNSAKNYSDRPFPGRHPSPKRPGMPVREFSPSGRRISPTGRKFSPPGRRFSPSGRRISPGRGSPSNRNMSPSGRRFSPPGRRISPSGRKFSPPGPGRKFSPPGRKFSPPGRKFSPPGRKFSPPGRKFSPPGRKFSPPGRRMSPTGRKFSPPGRRVSPSGMGRRISPSGKRISPSGIDRRLSPSGRKFSPPGRKFSPPGRNYSPTGRKFSPPGRRTSPPRGREDGRLSPSMTYPNQYLEDDLRNRMSRQDSPKRGSPGRRLVSPPRSGRYSPSPIEKSMDKYDDKSLKLKRPAYEADQAQNKSYTGGYREERDNAPYSGRPTPWQTDKSYPPKREPIRFEIMRRPDDKTPARESRSPTRRERSPLNRFRRQSPSSRSPHSPRRSWALEKRNSPESIREPPPPPVWPGQEPEEKLPRKSRFEPAPEPKHVPVWERLDRRVEERDDFEPKLRVRSDLGDKFSETRREMDDDREYRPDHDRRRDYREEKKRDDSPRRDKKTVLADIDKDFHDIYQRAVEFRKKAEELRKSGERRREHEDQPRDDDRRRRDDDKHRSPPRDRSRERETSKNDVWNTTRRTRMILTPETKLKRDKAIDEITNRILDKYDLTLDQKIRIEDELNLTLANIFINMFGDQEVSFIELVVKYNARFNAKDEERMLADLLSKLPSHYRSLKRKIKEDKSDIPAKSSRFSPVREVRAESTRPKLADAVSWSVGVEPPKVLNIPLMGTMNAMNSVMNMSPAMVPPPMYVPQVDMTQQTPQMYHDPQASYSAQQPAETASDTYNLYLCQDDFEPFSDLQADYLKNFLIAQMISVSETNQGWAPDFTLKGLQSMYRYEVSTRDVTSRDWLLNLNFAEFEFFNVLVYTKEELWYERAAIWLPGHSRVRSIEPLDKLKLQNKHLEQVGLGKWKFVKKVVTDKGTRLYVDMPPSSARALESLKMMLSYELQKVNVFLKAVAVDKDSFDAGLKETSLTDQTMLVAAVKNSAMPTLNANTDTSLVKIGLNGQKTITIDQARKIKEVIIYQLFKYHQNEGKSKTDFLRFGFCTSGCFAIVPENNESKRWLLGRHFGKINKHAIVVFGNDDDNTKYFKMNAYIPVGCQASTQLVFERLKQSNQGVKGIHFKLWKPISISSERKRTLLTVNVHLESVETLIKNKYKLDYVDENGIQRVQFKSEYSSSKLEEKIKRYKMEQIDSYDEAKMDLGSDDDEDNVICLD